MFVYKEYVKVAICEGGVEGTKRGASRNAGCSFLG